LFVVASTATFEVVRGDKFLIVPMTFEPNQFNNFEISISGPKNIRLGMMAESWTKKMAAVRLVSSMCAHSLLTTGSPSDQREHGPPRETKRVVA
jgi:hypothetical protein